MGDDDGNFKQIVQLVAKYCPELRHWLNMSRMRPYHVTYLSAQSQNKFIELIGHEVQRCIVQEIKDAGMYSVMADMTSDVSHKDRLAIACSYMDKMVQPRERLVSVTEAVDKTGEGGATKIIGSLTKQGQFVYIYLQLFDSDEVQFLNPMVHNHLTEEGIVHILPTTSWPDLSEAIKDLESICGTGSTFFLYTTDKTPLTLKDPNPPPEEKDKLRRKILPPLRTKLKERRSSGFILVSVQDPEERYRYFVK
ncbi:Hypothetical predicted protein [Paramuricea clavata]|uniref:Uncharacterized protein n=1 Tax=Paramuricea clavata TaxID=317549 RepID=A0A6S7KHJ7_PARCT|nr:Hypothetical predicted protein [Paramuricea clavata]